MDCSLASIKNAFNQGISAKTLKEKGCTAAKLRAAGYSAASYEMLVTQMMN